MILYGAKGQAKVCRDALRDDAVDLVAVFDRDSDLEPPFTDVPLLNSRDLGGWLQEQEDLTSLGFLVCFGGHRGRERLQIQSQIEAYGLTPLVARHPSCAIAPDAAIGLGSQICCSATISVEAVIGRACIVNTSASVDHECQLGDGVHIAPGATLAGCVRIGDFATVYTGATIGPRVSVGEGSIVGAGSVVLRDVPPGVLVVGSPARVVRQLKE